jgi:UDP-N-acetylglucosamine diphosphorylase / glucose-1-phosphate thymidylyltransferase / UDP-N-acetylgalactosamine diphosphorylase / glucosamine-1-phosphate N-acetyltransferase / galactosamine-1-phosphate N-acetyltransferase
MTQPVVLVLAGGVSSRFWPLRDKLLIPIGSQNLLERHLSTLSDLGCGRIVVVTRPDAAEAVADMGRSVSAEVSVAVQTEALGMADAVLCARPALEALGDGPLYVTQAHDVVERRLHAEMLEAWSDESAGLAGLIAGVRVKNYFPGGYLTLEGERVVSVAEKPGAGNEPSDLINLVAHVFGSWRQLVEALEEEAAQPGGDDVYERALSSLMRSSRFKAHVYEGRWQGLKYPWHLLDVMEMLLELWTSGAESPGAEYEQREDGVFLAPDARILPGAYAVAPALIGPGCLVGQNALVRGSVVGAGSVVGFGSEVARSFLVGDVELHHNYVGDSVMDRGSSMGFGATTANYRIDNRSVPSMIGNQRIDSTRMKLGLMAGANTRIGVNTSTMPGVKIGARAMIGPGLRVTRDVPDGERVLDEEKYGRF